MAEPKCQKGDVVMVKTSASMKKLHNHFGTTLLFIGDRKLPCCQQVHRNLWAVELASPIDTQFGPMRHFGLQDEDLLPIRPGKDPEGVDTHEPVDGLTA